MITQPGFFAFRWRVPGEQSALDDVAVVFKVPGRVDLAVLPDLLEAVCQGPVPPSAVVLLHVEQDDSLLSALASPAVEGALLRFNGRMPLAVFSVQLPSFSVRVVKTLGVSHALRGAMVSGFSDVSGWLQAGLAQVFDPKLVIVTAPAGFAFHKPSSRRSSFFIRADLALATSAAVFFVAFAIFHRLLLSYRCLPQELKLLFVDTMAVASTAFALREILSLSGVNPLPQVDSFHSYGGFSEVRSPLPDTSLCIISASSSMNLHRQWIEQKRLSSRDVVTLVTFDDAPDREHALYAMPSRTRPEELRPSAKYDIRIEGENFFPVMEPARKVLLTTTHHACGAYTAAFFQLHDSRVFGTYTASPGSQTRRSVYIDADQLLAAPTFRRWVDQKVPQWLKAGTTQIVFQEDQASRVLAQHIAYIATALRLPPPKVLPASSVSPRTVTNDGSIVCVGAVVGGGNALLALSRELRNCHQGARLYVIGFQAVESAPRVETFDKNLKYSSHGAAIEVLRMRTFLASESVAESFRDELSALYSGVAPVPTVLLERADKLRAGPGAAPVMLPTGPDLQEDLNLNEDFAFWPKGYAAGPHQAEVIGTISAILQNARTNTSIDVEQRLRSPMLKQVALDPENFARFNDGVIQAALLRAALPSELDFRGDEEASRYVAALLMRMASRYADAQVPTLEFLNAIAIRRLQFNANELAHVRQSFQRVASDHVTPLAQAVRFLIGRFPGEAEARRAF
jgi:hypothetical protein